jgi:hypothetical protein
MMRPGALLIAVTALLAIAAVAGAQSSGRPTSESFRIEWVRRPPSMRPGVDGYIYNDSRWRVTNLRVRAVVVDAAGSTVRETVVSVWGNAVPGTRTFFVLPAIGEGQVYQLTVISFDLISEQNP